MSVQTYSQTPDEIVATISVTEAAAEHLRAQLASRKRSGVRLSLKEAGCTGFKYVIDEVDAPVEGDLQVQAAEGVTVFIDRAHVAALKGLQIDYVTAGLNQQLVLTNPNIKDECGCGESFSV